MLYGYFDESGEHSLDGKLQQLTLGGFVARRPEIEKLCQDWCAALDQSGMADFHMRVFASDEAGYARWDVERQKRLDSFINALCRNITHYCAFSYTVTTQGTAFKDAYETALARVMINAAGVARRSDDRIKLVFAHTQEIKGELIQRYFDRLNWREDGIQGVSHEMSDGCPPLQAAEIVARGMRRKVQDGLVTHSFAKMKAAAKCSTSGCTASSVRRARLALQLGPGSPSILQEPPTAREH